MTLSLWLCGWLGLGLGGRSCSLGCGHSRWERCSRRDRRVVWKLRACLRLFTVLIHVVTVSTHTHLAELNSGFLDSMIARHDNSFLLLHDFPVEACRTTTTSRFQCGSCIARSRTYGRLSRQGLSARINCAGSGTSCSLRHRRIRLVGKLLKIVFRECILRRCNVVWSLGVRR